MSGAKGTRSNKGWLLETLSNQRVLLVLATITIGALYLGNENKIAKIGLDANMLTAANGAGETSTTSGSITTSSSSSSKLQSQGAARYVRSFPGTTDQAPTPGEPLLYAMSTLVLSKEYFDTAMSMCASIHAGKI